VLLRDAMSDGRIAILDLMADERTRLDAARQAFRDAARHALDGEVSGNRAWPGPGAAVFPGLPSEGDVEVVDVGEFDFEVVGAASAVLEIDFLEPCRASAGRLRLAAGRRRGGWRTPGTGQGCCKV
jgi:hypothetical protein